MKLIFIGSDFYHKSHSFIRCAVKPRHSGRGYKALPRASPFGDKRGTGGRWRSGRSMTLSTLY